MKTCLFCGHPLQLVHVHGHYQCKVCGTNALPCCDGDNCETNEMLKPEQGLLREVASTREQQLMSRESAHWRAVL